MLTAAQICTEAAAISKARGFTAQAGRALNLVLDDLVLKHDLKINREETTISLTAGTVGPYNLAQTYLRTYDLFFEQSGQRYFLHPVSTEHFDGLYRSSAVATYPYCYATDISAQADNPSTGIATISVYPQSNAALTLTHRFMIRRDQITTPETSSTVPWFFDQDFLIHATARRLMRITDDQRYERFMEEEVVMLRPYLIMEGDEQQVVKSVKLDPQRFRLRRFIKDAKFPD